MPKTAATDTPRPAHGMGFQPLIDYVRVRTPSGIPSTTPDGRARFTKDGTPIMAQRGELLCCRTWKHAQLMIDNKSVLPISEQDWEGAPTCPHGARWADEALAAGCRCDEPAKVTSL